MRLARSAAINMASVVATALTGALAIALLARLLDVHEFGRIVLLLTVANAVAIFEGLRPVVVYEVASGHRPWGQVFLAARHISVASAAVLGAAAVCVVSLVPALGFSFAESLVAGLVVCAFFAAVFFWSFLDAEGETAFSGGVRGLAWIAVYAAFVVLAFVDAEFVAYLCAIALMNMALAVCYMLRLQRLRTFPRAGDFDGTSAVRDLLRPALQNIATNVSAVTLGVSDRLVIGAMLGSAAAGLYMGPSEFATKPAAFLRAIAQVMYPAAAKLAAVPGSIDEAWRRFTSLALLAAVSATAVIVFLRVQVVELLLGTQFAAGADVFGILCAAFSLSVAGYAAVVYLNAHGDFVTQRTLYAVAAVVMVLAALLAAPRWGIVGVAWAFLGGRLVDLVMCGRVVRSLDADCRVTFLLLLAAGALAQVMAWQGNAWGAAVSLVAAWIVGMRMFVPTLPVSAPGTD